jgi:DNA invertase Pin-like site-specific DNA recombinase
MAHDARMSTPVAYLRKSRVTLASPGELSHESQLQAVRDLAAQHGDPEPLVLSDWSRSGRHGARRRPGYAELIRMIEAGEASAVYSYSLSRLSRSLRDFATLVDIAQRHDVPIRLARDTMNLSTASGRLNVNVLASVSAFEAEIAQERARDTIAARRARGDDVGSAPYGYILRAGRLEPDPQRPVEAVLAAYRSAGTYNGAARLLNAQGAAPAPRGARWSGEAVRRVVNRAMPETRSTDGRPGRKARRDFRLAGLLVCGCGTLMTGRHDVHRTPYGTYHYVTYRCWRSRTEADHPRPFMVNEGVLLPWVQAEVARLHVPERVELADDTAQRDAIEAKRLRIVDTYTDGIIDKAERDRRLAAIADELANLEAVTALVDVPEVDWSWEPAALNRVLRALFRRIELGPDLRPVRAEWTVPEWRA